MRAMSLVSNEGEGEQNEIRILQDKLNSTMKLVSHLTAQLNELKEQVCTHPIPGSVPGQPLAASILPAPPSPHWPLALGLDEKEGSKPTLPSTQLPGRASEEIPVTGDGELKAFLPRHPPLHLALPA
ncbi:Inositol 1,4,5-trisphosphate receptor type 3 [Plecturocebus cupreus]